MSPAASAKARLSRMDSNHRLADEDTWLSAPSGIIAGQGDVSHEYKIQNGNMPHEEPLRGYRACVNDPKTPLAAGLLCKSGRKMG